MATMRDIAQLTGVSTATVSHVVNGTKRLSPETTRMVMDAVRALGYKLPSTGRAPLDQTSAPIGVLVEDVRCFPSPDILCGIAEALENHQRRMLVHDLHLYEKLYNQYELIGAYREQINKGISLLAEGHAAGVIYVAMHDRHLDGLIDASGKPLVYAYSLGAASDSYVTYANKESASDAARHLIGLGHKRIAVIAGHPHSFPAMKRLSGFLIAMQEAGLSIPEPYLAYGNWEYDSGYERMLGLLKLPEPPTAVFAMNDFMAAGALHAALDSGLEVPEDLSVIGFDNRESSSFLRPQLTTYDLPVREIGRQAANTLMQMLSSPGASPQSIVLPCTFIHRQSTGSPREFTVKERRSS